MLCSRNSFRLFIADTAPHPKSQQRICVHCMPTLLSYLILQSLILGDLIFQKAVILTYCHLILLSASATHPFLSSVTTFFGIIENTALNKVIIANSKETALSFL